MLDVARVEPCWGPGTLVLGRYRVAGVLGRGPHGVTVGAHDEASGVRTRVALKIATTIRLTTAERRAFFADVEACASLTGPAAARVLGAEIDRDGAPYLITPWLEAEPLSSWLDRDGALGLRVAADVVLAVASAIGEAHARGAPHGNLQATHVFVERGQRGPRPAAIRVADFAMATLVAHRRPASQPPRPPEVHAGARPDRRSDVWSLARMLHRLLAGPPPDASKRALLPLRQRRADVPAPLEALVVASLDPDPRRRPASATDFSAQLEASLRPTVPLRRTPAPSASPPTAPLAAWLTRRR